MQNPSGASLLRPAVVDDIRLIVAMEKAAEARNFVGQWPEERHRHTLLNGDARYFVSGGEQGELQAFAILRGIKEASRSIELKRLVVATPGKGLGRRILKQLIYIVFEEFGAHRMFLDVYEDNMWARHLYESLGFVQEGIMREAGERGGEFISLRLMSMLDREYEVLTGLTAASPPPL